MKKLNKVALSTEVVQNSESRMYWTTTTFFWIFSMSMALSWIKIQYLNINVLNWWSFLGSDKPWLPERVSGAPIIGAHYFGDFQLQYFLTQSINPYYSQFNVTPPLGLIPNVLFLNLFSLKAATFIYLGLCILLFMHLIHKILLYIGYSWKLYFNFIPLAFCNDPVLSALDRGGFTWLAMILLCHALLILWYKDPNKKSKRDHYLSLILLVGAVSLKPYLASILIALFFTKFRKITLQAGFLTLTCNFLLSFFFKGPANVLHGLLVSYKFQTGSADNISWLYSGVSFSGGIAKASEFLFGSQNSLKFLDVYQHFSFLPGLLWLTIVIVLIRRTLESDPKDTLPIVFLLSLAQYFSPVSMSYTGIWAVFAIPLVWKSSILNSKAKHTLVGGLIFQLTLEPFYWWQLVPPFTWLLSTTAILFLIRSRI